MSSSNRHTHSMGLIPIVRPRCTSKSVMIKLTDNPPSSSSPSTAISPSTPLRVCRTCHKMEARYSCPKCSWPYCSVGCYRGHNLECTETFHRERVTDELNFQVKDNPENLKKLHEILQRVSASDRVSECEGENDESSTRPLVVEIGDSQDRTPWEQTDDEHRSQIEPYNSSHPGAGPVTDSDADDDDENVDLFRSFMEQSDNNNEANLLRHGLDGLVLTPEMRRKFERDVASGKLSHLIAPWNPWWMPELTTFATTPEDGACKVALTNGENDELGHSYSSQEEMLTLDEQLLAVSPFELLCPKQSKLAASSSSSNTSVPSVALQYNIVDLIYATALTLRLYNGDQHFKGDPIGAASSLIYASRVLSNDARYQSTTEALSASAEHSTKSMKIGECNTPAYILAEDVLVISKNWRFVAKALLSSIEILREAGRKKLHSKSNKKTRSTDKRSRNFRQARKKLEFYVSWCVTYWQEVSQGSNGAANCIELWIKEQNGRD